MIDTALPSVLAQSLKTPFHICLQIGAAWEKSYQKSLLILFTVTVDISSFSIFGNKIFQLIFRVNCSTCSVTDKTLLCPKLSCLCLAVPAQLYSSAMIHQEAQLDEKAGLSFSEA